ncbi:replication-relaxation family protein [Spirillospora sp. CA-108201]
MNHPPPDVPAGPPFGVRRQAPSTQATGAPDSEARRTLSPFGGGSAPASPRSASPSPEGEGTRPAPPAKSRNQPLPRPSPPLPPHRINARAQWLEPRLSVRDWAILDTLYRVNMATSGQLQRMHFYGLAQAIHARKRTLKRLVRSGALIAPPRRVGGPQGGSQQRIYSLDPAARMLMQMRVGVAEDEPGDSGYLRALRLAQHTLTVSELYTRCVELARNAPVDIVEFQAEPQCWWPLDRRRYLKPDAHLRLANFDNQIIDNWWLEVDLGTERARAIRDKFRRYLSFYASGEPGPDDAIPRVLVTAPDNARAKALTRAVARLGPYAQSLIHVTAFDAATTFLATFSTTPIQPPNEPTERNEP